MIAEVQQAQPTWKKFLRSKNFHALMWGALLAHTGLYARMIALEWVVYEMTKNRTLTALFPAMLMGPTAIFSLFSGTVVDMFDRKKLIIFFEFILLIACLLQGYYSSLTGDHYLPLLALTLITGITYSFEGPARVAVSFFAFEKEEQRKFIPIFALTFYGGRFIGPLVGGLLLAEFDAAICFYLNAAAYAAMILSLLCVKFAVEPHTSASRNFKLEFLQGLNYVRQTPLIRRMIFLATSVSAVGTFHLSLMPAIAKDLLGLQEVGYGQTAGSMGLGSVLAALVIIVTAHQPIKKYLFPASMFALTAALFALSITKTPWLAWTFIGLTGFCFVIATLICRKTIQLNAPQELLGRIVGIEVWAMIGSTGIGFPIFGWLAQRYSLAFTFQIAAVILLLCSLSWFYRKSDFASIDAMS